MNNEAFTALIKYLSTVSNAARFTEKLETVLRGSERSDMEKSLKDMCTQEEFELIQKIKQENQGIRELLQNIISEMKQIPALQITVAVQPSWACQQSLAQTLQNAVHENFLIRFVERETIIAGAIIDFKGKRTDLSVQNKLRNYM